MDAVARLLIVIALVGIVAIATPLEALEPICSSPAVIFCEDWETTTLPGRWADGYDATQHTLTTNPTNVYKGSKALQTLWKAGTDGGKWLTTWFTPNGQPPSSGSFGYDHVFYRAFIKWNSPWACDPGTNACGKQVALYGLQSGISGPLNAWSGFGQAGVCPTGSDFFYSAAASVNSPLRNEILYTYYPEMPCPGYGQYFPPATTTPFPVDTWTCIEAELQANTPGVHDGLQRLWMNGNLIVETTGIRFRDTTNLKIGALQLTFSWSGTLSANQYSLVDNIVVSSQRVGCGTSAGAVPSDPTNVQVN